MTMYVAFLRGINVGGRNLLKMQDVRQEFNDLGFDNVSSYKASGNILFEANTKPDDAVKSIKTMLHNLSGRALEVFLRAALQIDEILELDPFKGREVDPSKLYITFIPNELSEGPMLPLWSRNKDVEIFLVKDSEVYSQTYLHRGSYGAPNKFIEKEFNVPATTRNWNTIRGIHEKFIRD